MVKPISREIIINRRQPLVRWSAVLAGTALAVGLSILLQTLGMGIGLSAVDTDDAGNLKGVGIGTGIWSMPAPLIALFRRRLPSRPHGRNAPLSTSGAMLRHLMWALATATEPLGGAVDRQCTRGAESHSLAAPPRSPRDRSSAHRARWSG